MQVAGNDIRVVNRGTAINNTTRTAIVLTEGIQSMHMIFPMEDQKPKALEYSWAQNMTYGMI